MHKTYFTKRLVGGDEDHSLPELVLGQHAHQLVPGLAHVLDMLDTLDTLDEVLDALKDALDALDFLDELDDVLDALDELDALDDALDALDDALNALDFLDALDNALDALDTFDALDALDALTVVPSPPQGLFGSCSHSLMNTKTVLVLAADDPHHVGLVGLVTCDRRVSTCCQCWSYCTIFGYQMFQCKIN